LLPQAGSAAAAVVSVGWWAGWVGISRAPLLAQLFYRASAAAGLAAAWQSAAFNCLARQACWGC